jgi:hypothetical protein
MRLTSTVSPILAPARQLNQNQIVFLAIAIGFKPLAVSLK